MARNSSFLSSFALTLGLALGIGLVSAPMVGLVGAAPTPGKIGVIDLEKTLYETPAGKRASDAFDKTRKAKQAELDKRQKDLQKAAAELDKQAAVLKPDVLTEKKKVLEKQFVELQQTYMKLERDLAGERTKLVQDVLAKATPIIEQIAKDEGVMMILDHSAVLWRDDSVDLTAKLNAKMK
ncbi:MAG: OmpH family outer membrane protein [Kofleriaceae bacterium]|jgi:Skp family chaperone for outer membrane proteins|nr:OmpH family outer membrane protein [Kofleriaceae bacterium]MBP9172882.1 OmpH family outer membrane protein [Kofleriaceae bacterium]MBP9863741.1 OmpH family outer membrane protein [Kofleriaceae bacterium]